MPESPPAQAPVSQYTPAEPLPVLGTADLHPAFDIPLIHDAIRPDIPQWTPAELRALTRLVGSRMAGTLLGIVEFPEQRRWWARLGLTAGVELWLLSWSPGQGTLPHDHGGASGAFTVLFGELHEDYRYSPGRVRKARHNREASIAFDGRRAHQVRNLGSANAASVHAYSPPLLPVRHFSDLAAVPPPTGDPATTTEEAR